MKNKKKNNKKILIIVGIVLVLGIGIVLIFNNKNKNKTISCEKVESNEIAKISTKILVNKKGKKLHLNYDGRIEIFQSDEIIQTFLNLYVEKQVSKFKEIDDSMATLEKTQNQIVYEFDFNIDSSIENEIKDLIGIYSYDVEELKEHFESDGAICEES